MCPFSQMFSKQHIIVHMQEHSQRVRLTSEKSPLVALYNSCVSHLTQYVNQHVGAKKEAKVILVLNTYLWYLFMIY